MPVQPTPAAATAASLWTYAEKFKESDAAARLSCVLDDLLGAPDIQAFAAHAAAFFSAEGFSRVVVVWRIGAEAALQPHDARALIDGDEALATRARLADGWAADDVRGRVAACIDVQAEEGIGVIVAMVVLLITFGSVVAAGLPMLTALIGVGTGVSGILWASSAIEMSTSALSSS